MAVASLMDVACLVIRACLVAGRIKKINPLGACLLDVASLTDVACLVIRGCLVAGKIKKMLHWSLVCWS